MSLPEQGRPVLHKNLGEYAVKKHFKLWQVGVRP